MADPSLILFDVNETLSDLAPLAGRFEAIGADPALAPVWFASLLRDGFALAVTGRNRPFAEVGTAVLRGVLAAAGHPADRLDADAAAVVAALAEVPLHDDVAGGVEALAGAGLRLATLTNGSASVAERLLSAAGLRGRFERLLSVEDAPAWKPAAAAYRYALDACGVAAEEAVLVAVHPWDVHGAACVGLATAWVNRSGGPWPAVLKPPTWTVGHLAELADRLG